MFLFHNRFTKNINIFLLVIFLLGIFVFPVTIMARTDGSYTNFLESTKLMEAMDYLKEGQEILISCQGCTLATIRRITVVSVDYVDNSTSEWADRNILVNGDVVDIAYVYVYNTNTQLWQNLSTLVSGLKLTSGAAPSYSSSDFPPMMEQKQLLIGDIKSDSNTQFISLPTAEKVAEAEQYLHNSEKIMTYCEPCGDKKYDYKVVSGVDFTFDEKDGVYYFTFGGVTPADLAYVYIYENSGWENLAMKLGLSPKGVSARLLEEKLSGPTGCYCYIDGDRSVKDKVAGVLQKSECEDLASSGGAEFGGKKVEECVWNQTSGVDEDFYVKPVGTSPLISGITGIEKLNIFGYRKLTDIVGKILRAVIGLMGSIAFIMFVYSGLTYMTAMGNAEKQKKAQKIMIWTALGLFVILGSYTILAFVMQILPL